MNMALIAQRIAPLMDQRQSMYDHEHAMDETGMEHPVEHASGRDGLPRARGRHERRVAAVGERIDQDGQRHFLPPAQWQARVEGIAIAKLQVAGRTPGGEIRENRRAAMRGTSKMSAMEI